MGQPFAPAVAALSLTLLAAAEPQHHYYRPPARVPVTLEPFLTHLEPGRDAFPDEKEAAELGQRLRELGAAWRRDPARAGAAAQALLAPGFRGGRLAGAEEAVPTAPPLEVSRAKGLAGDPALDAPAFAAELQGLFAGWERLETAELLITGIGVERAAAPQARLEVRYDLVGSGAA
ncbi:MAG TPA: hypothetical protein VF310_00805, partial [Vicinamibacteria bacterium]